MSRVVADKNNNFLGRKKKKRMRYVKHADLSPFLLIALHVGNYSLENGMMRSKDFHNPTRFSYKHF